MKRKCAALILGFAVAAGIATWFYFDNTSDEPTAKQVENEIAQNPTE